MLITLFGNGRLKELYERDIPSYVVVYEIRRYGFFDLFFFCAAIISVSLRKIYIPNENDDKLIKNDYFYCCRQSQ